MSPARKDVNQAIFEFSKEIRPGSKILFVGVDPVWNYKFQFDHCVYETLDIKTSRHPDILGDIQNCPQIKDKTYDAIIMTGVYEYLDKPYIAIEEIYRVLKDKGKLLICMPGIAYYGDKRPTVTIEEIEIFLSFALSQ